MKPPTTGDTVRVILSAIVIEAKHGVTICRVQTPCGVIVWSFGADGQGRNGARVKRAKLAKGVKVK